MQIAVRPVMLFAALILGSFALGAATTARLSAAPAAPPRAVQVLPFSGGDPSVPSASTIAFPAGDDTAAPTF